MGGGKYGWEGPTRERAVGNRAGLVQQTVSPSRGGMIQLGEGLLDTSPPTELEIWERLLKD